jgi:hypothetical protein
MNGDDALTLDVSLDALGLKGRDWNLREFADGADPAAPETVIETTRDLGDTRTLTLHLASGGGYAATLSLIGPTHARVIRQGCQAHHRPFPPQC